jgi:hypothetical protein
MKIHSSIKIKLSRTRGLVVTLTKPLKKKSFLKLYINRMYCRQIPIKKHQKEIIIQVDDNTYSARVVHLNLKSKVIGKSKECDLLGKYVEPQPRLNSTMSNYLNSSLSYALYPFENIASNSSININMDSGGQDFDLYAKWEGSSSWDFRSATASGNESIVIAGSKTTPIISRTLYVLVYRYSGAGFFNLTVKLQKQEDPISWTVGSKKCALIVGISDYLNISDLSYCDEDATDWFNVLTTQGYECRVLGDQWTQNYPRHDGLATKQNLRQGIQDLAKTGADQIMFVTSGHGAASNVSAGDAFLCAYDGQSYHDTELVQDLQPHSGQKIVLIDHCSSGGFIDNLSTLSNIFIGTTCSVAGYGYDVPTYQNGAFTYLWMQAVLEFESTLNSTPLVELFQYVSQHYNTSSSSADQPVHHTDTALMVL